MRIRALISISMSMTREHDFESAAGTPYIAVYVIIADRIRILRIWHSAQMWPPNGIPNNAGYGAALRFPSKRGHLTAWAREYPAFCYSHSASGEVRVRSAERTMEMNSLSTEIWTFVSHCAQAHLSSRTRQKARSAWLAPSRPACASSKSRRCTKPSSPRQARLKSNRCAAF